MSAGWGKVCSVNMPESASEAFLSDSNGERVQGIQGKIWTVLPFALYRRAASFQLAAQVMSPPRSVSWDRGSKSGTVLGEAVGKKDRRQQTALLILVLLQWRCSYETQFSINCLSMLHLLFPPVSTSPDCCSTPGMPSFSPTREAI